MLVAFDWFWAVVAGCLLGFGLFAWFILVSLVCPVWGAVAYALRVFLVQACVCCDVWWLRGWFCGFVISVCFGF